MTIETRINIDYDGIDGAVEQATPRILRSLVSAQADIVKVDTPQRTGDLYRSIGFKVYRAVSVLIIGEYYWRFVLEYGSWLQVPSRRKDPPKIVSGAAVRVLGSFNRYVVGEIARVEQLFRTAHKRGRKIA